MLPFTIEDLPIQAHMNTMPLTVQSCIYFEKTHLNICDIQIDILDDLRIGKCFPVMYCLMKTLTYPVKSKFNIIQWFMHGTIVEYVF